MAVNWGSAKANTNAAAYLTNCLAPYVGGKIEVYKCPGDTIPSDNGDRIRSISMNGQMGAIYTSTGVFNPGWRTYIKFSDLTAPGPVEGLDFPPMKACTYSTTAFWK